MSEQTLDDILRRHTAFWKREPVDQPLLNIESNDTKYELAVHEMPLSDGTILSDQTEALTPDLIDPSLILDAQEFPMRNEGDTGPGPLIVEDLLVTRAPLGKMVWVESILGCPVIPRLDTGSIYSAPFLDDPGDLSKIPSLENNAWFDVLKEYTRALAEDSAGTYQVVQCLQRGTIDLASAVLGHSEMCYAIIDQPKELRALVELCTETFIKVAKAQQDLTPPLNGGWCNPFAVWAPGTVVRTQCDVSSSVSAETYEELFFPYEVELCSKFDYSAVHIHSGYVHTVDVFLKDKYPSAIQISLDTGSTPNTVQDLMPVFARVLEEKPLFIMGRMTRSELDEILGTLPARGLYVSGRLQDEE
jgi:hypothetical protein